MKDYGIWLPVEMTPDDHATVGVPIIGDIVKVKYNSNNPASGWASRISTPHSTSRQYETKEYGGSFLYTANLL